MNNEQQLEKMERGPGFIAALDQSGGSTPKALRLYGVEEGAYETEEEMFDLVHEMRTRIITSRSFGGDRILGAILFVGTMERRIGDLPTASFLWEKKGVVPFLKVDKGLADPADGVQVMKPMPDLGDLLERALENQIFGTKMRSMILSADPAGIQQVVDQQFAVARQILDAGLVPIIEPEVDIHAPDKAEAEDLLLARLGAALDGLAPSQRVVLKLTLPEADNLYAGCIAHSNVIRVAALSGGYSREEANARLRRNEGMIASFSRALTEGLSAQQSDEEFDAVLDQSIESIYLASST